MRVLKHPHFPKLFLQKSQGWFIIKLETKGYLRVRRLFNRKHYNSDEKFFNGLQGYLYLQ